MRKYIIAIAILLSLFSCGKQKEIDVVSESLKPYYEVVDYTLDSITFYKSNGKAFKKEYKSLVCVGEDGYTVRLPYTTTKRTYNIFKIKLN